MSKLSFRARALDASKPMPIFMAEELPDLPDYSAINRAVPQMPSGMTKEEECEHHLQRAICAGLIIPTPEVSDLTEMEAYDRIYPADYKLPRQLIHMQPFAMEQDIPDYDMDSEDEKFVGIQSRKMELTPLQFEEMMDRLEKSSGQNVVTLGEAKALLKEDDDLIIAVFDYWLNKRLKTQHPLLLTVKTEHRLGSAANNPYLAFRRITEKMQTRKNRKNDETSYEKMLKLRRDLSRAVTLLELVKRREKTKREHLHLTIEVYEKRYQAEDFSGQILSEVSALKTTRPAFAPLFTNQFGVHQNWVNKACSKEDGVPRKEKRQYKKRKHKLDGRSTSGLDDNGLRGMTGASSRASRLGSGLDPLASSDEDNPFPHTQLSMQNEREDEDNANEGPYAFKRSRYCSYLPPVSGGFGNWPWCDKDEGGNPDKKFRFALTSISKPTPRCIGLARRRLGRGGRVILDRWPSNTDDIWSSLDFTIHEPQRQSTDSTETATTTTATTIPTAMTSTTTTNVKKEWLHFRPKSPPAAEHAQSDEGSGWATSSSDSESETFDTTSSSHAIQLPYPFPPEATSLCVDVEADRPGDEAPFTSEFNIADYFSVDSLPDFDLGLATNEEHQLGSSRFQVTPINNVFSCRNNQCSVVTSVNISSVATTTSSLSSSTSTSVPSSTIAHVESPTISPLKHANQHNIHQHHPRQLMNNAASILSKSLTSPTSKSASLRHTNFGNGHQNGPSNQYLHNANNLVVTTCSSGGHVVQNSSSASSSSIITTTASTTTTTITTSVHNTHMVNSQSTILLPQKHSPSSLLPGFIAQSKFASLARQGQQQQPQQIPTSGEITLNSNSEGLDMEVDGVEGSPCEGKSQQQQQLVRANKTNSLAMEVT